MSELEVITQGIRGGLVISKRQGKVVATTKHNQKSVRIEVDNYEGAGDTYKQREIAQVSVQSNGREWKGSVEELLKVLNL